MHEFVVRLTNGISIKRCHPSDHLLTTLAALRKLVEESEERFSGKVEHVVVRDKPNEVLTAQGIHFVNICGKIDHLHHQKIYLPGVEPLLVPVKNSFGSFRGLYSDQCNLLTCTSKSSTLFRGARSAARVLKVVKHAINPDNISAMSVHMLVANGRLGHGVCINSYYLEHHMSRDSRWHCQSLPPNEDMSYVKSMRLSDFATEFLQSLKVPVPRAVLINISKHGSVNFFMTMEENVPFNGQVEALFKPLFVSMLEALRVGC